MQLISAIVVVVCSKQGESHAMSNPTALILDVTSGIASYLTVFILRLRIITIIKIPVLTVHHYMVEQ